MTDSNVKRIGTGQHGYLARYKGKHLGVMADTTYEAQCLAAKEFKAKKSWEVDVGLCELNGKTVVHTAVD